ncbi:MAG TPA: M28 family metallopeptidase [Thermoanaerobaculia bacterium]|nr:M28 family metallopeptidase [Thermoanaerobaculia bacterium]
MQASRARSVALVGALAFAVLAAAAPGPLPSVAAGRVEAHLRVLAADRLAGRAAGSAGHDEAALYVAGRFRAFGLTPAVGDGYLQPVPLREARLQRGSATLTVRVGGERRRLAWGEDFLMRGDPARRAVEVSAPLVFAGFGVSAPELGHDDYAGLEVAGKAVLVLSGAPARFPSNPRAYYSSSDTKRHAARSRGAVALVTVASRTDDGRVPWERRVRHAGRPAMDWLDPGNGAPHAAGTLQAEARVSHRGAAELLAGSGRTLDELLARGSAGRAGGFALPAVLQLRARSQHRDLTSPNVLGVLPGSDPRLRSEHVVVTAHLDAHGTGVAVNGDRIYNGAYDNALGVAILLEVARTLAEAAERPRRSLLFAAVTAEEKGLLGAEYLAHHPPVPLASLVANVNLDMPLFLFPVDEVVAYGAEHSTLGEAAAGAFAAAGFALVPDPMPDEVIFVRSDQYPFVERGIPALYPVPGNRARDPAVDGEAVVRQFLATHYHMPSDDLALPVDWESVARFTRGVALLVRDVADAAEAPAWKEGDFFAERFARR